MDGSLPSGIWFADNIADLRDENKSLYLSVLGAKGGSMYDLPDEPININNYGYY